MMAQTRKYYREVLGLVASHHCKKIRLSLHSSPCTTYQKCTKVDGSYGLKVSESGLWNQRSNNDKVT